MGVQKRGIMKAVMLANPRIRLEPGQHLESRHVLAGAYRGRGRRGSASNLEDRVLLTHSVIVDSTGRDMRTLCGFDKDRLGDTYGETAEGLLLPPTCMRCRPIWDRLQHAPNARRQHAPNASHEVKLCEYCVSDWNRATDTERRKMLQYPRPASVCQICGDLPSEVVTFEDAYAMKLPLWFNERHRQLFAFFQSVPSASAADALRAVPEAKAGDVRKLHERGILVSAPSPGRANMMRLADQWRAHHTPNASYYVWVLSPSGEPLSSEGPYGPHDLEGAKTFARISATEGDHDRAVSRGLDPQSPSFEVVRRYRRRTGERAL